MTIPIPTIPARVEPQYGYVDADSLPLPPPPFPERHPMKAVTPAAMARRIG